MSGGSSRRYPPELRERWLTAAPVRVVRAALKRVEQGDLRGDLVVFDGTELGELQRGFNAMVNGLRERERVRDLFGRHVGREVAAAAERERPQLGGEDRHAAVVFVDIVGSTQLVDNQPAAHVVKLLNRFFAIVVNEVDRHHGLINKFAGDAALAIFGAPNRLDRPEDAALAAARAIAERLANEMPEVQAGIGVAAGQIVAGNVGAKQRFEYTVVGKPVNQAARLCELAKSHPARLLASSDTLHAASETDRAPRLPGPPLAEQQTAGPAGPAGSRRIGAVTDQRAPQQRLGGRIDHAQHDLLSGGGLGRGICARAGTQGLHKPLVVGRHLRTNRLVLQAKPAEQRRNTGRHLVGARSQHLRGRTGCRRVGRANRRTQIRQIPRGCCHEFRCDQHERHGRTPNHLCAGATTADMAASLSENLSCHSSNMCRLSGNAATNLERPGEEPPGDRCTRRQAVRPARTLAKKGNIPVGYYKDEKKTAETFRTINGVRYAIPVCARRSPICSGRWKGASMITMP